MQVEATPEPVTLARASPAASPSRPVLILVALWLVVFFASCFTPPILDDADGTHANAARQMLLSHDWITLRVNNVRYLEKAPLPYWIVAVCFKLFGLNAFAAHLPQALAVLALALLGFRWSREAYGDRAAFYTALFTLTSAGVFLFTRVFIPDVLLALLLALALYTILKSLEPHSGPAFSPAANEAVILTADQKRRISRSVPFSPGAPFTARPQRVVGGIVQSRPATQTLYPYALWTTLALAVLTKGLVALVFLFGTAALYLALTGDFRRWRRLRPITGALLFLAIAAPWHILAGLRNTEGMNGHGFFWFYFVNEHFLRFLGRRIPKDYNKLPGYLYWTLHLVWLFPWSLFLPLVFAQRPVRSIQPIQRDTSYKGFLVLAIFSASACIGICTFFGLLSGAKLALAGAVFVLTAGLSAWIAMSRWRTGDASRQRSLFPEQAPTPTQRTTLLLTLFSTIVLVFFSLSTNQEYYTLPAYLPLLILLAAALARTEESSELTTHNSQLTTVRFAHLALTVLGLLIAAALTYGLWTSRGIPAPSDIGALLAHRGVGDYTLSMSSLFDLTGPSFAALRLPAALALAAFAIGPAIAWYLRTRRQNLAATCAIALTSATFLVAAHIALGRFAPMLSSEDMAQTILRLEHTGQIAPSTDVFLFGDQAYGSSIGFYLNRPLDHPIRLVDGRSSSMLFGSYFPDAQAQHLFLTPAELLDQWGTGPRKILFIPIERRNDAERLLAPYHPVLLEETSGKLLLTDRPLDQ